MAIISSQQGLGGNPEFVQVCRGGCSTLNPQLFIRAPVSFERQHEEKEAMPFHRTLEGQVVPSLLWVPPLHPKPRSPWGAWDQSPYLPALEDQSPTHMGCQCPS